MPCNLLLVLAMSHWGKPCPSIAGRQNIEQAEPTKSCADLDQALDCTCYELPIWTEPCHCNRSLEAEMVQQHLTFPIDQQSFAFYVDCKQQQPIRADAQSSELS